eukprot:20869-Alexandrium_andersonii.AAC.1
MAAQRDSAVFRSVPTLNVQSHGMRAPCSEKGAYLLATPSPHSKDSWADGESRCASARHARA